MLSISRSGANRLRRRMIPHESGVRSRLRPAFLEVFANDFQISKCDWILLFVRQQGNRPFETSFSLGIVLQLKMVPTDISLRVVAIGIQPLGFVEISRGRAMVTQPM